MNELTTMGADSGKETKLKKSDEKPLKNLIILLAVIFLASFPALMYIYKCFPELEESEKKDVKIPFNLEDAKALGRVLAKYKHEHSSEVLIGIMLVYVFLQTCAIPGSLFLSILLGFLFNFWTALTTICFCSALGASLCFFVSASLAKPLVIAYFPDKLEAWAVQVNKHRSDIFSYILFLRMTPLLPNWFINLASPIIDVPLYPFVLGTFFGVAPPSLVAIEAGKTLYKMTSSSDAFSTKSVVMLGAFSLLALLPVVFKRQFKAKLE